MRKRHEGKVLAVLGASAFQAPLIARARELGCEVHAFAWACGDPGERLADEFHPVSTADREAVLAACREARADGACTIGSDFNNAVATWVANRLGLPANPDECARLSTDKRAMRRALSAGGDPCPGFVAFRRGDDVAALASGLRPPLVVKPADRSGSRGVSLVGSRDGLAAAAEAALRESFCGAGVAEEYLEGDEYSVECVSWGGRHEALQVTRKFTTGAPRFVETAHLQPCGLPPEADARVRAAALHALGTLGVVQGASHAELRVGADGEPRIVEVGSRMGGDLIGSHLVPLSTGVDYVGAVVDAALGAEPDLSPRSRPRAAAVRFVLTGADARALARLRDERPGLVVEAGWREPSGQEVTDSSARFGHCVMAAESADELLPWLPGGEADG